MKILDDADGRHTREVDLLAFHGRRLVDDQHHGGALGRSGRREFGGEGALDRIFGRVLVIHVAVALAGNPERSAAALHKRFHALFIGRAHGVEIVVIEDHQLRVVEIGGQRFRGREVESIGLEDLRDVLLAAFRIVGDPIDFGTAHRDCVLKAGFAETGGLHLAG